MVLEWVGGGQECSGSIYISLGLVKSRRTCLGSVLVGSGLAGSSQKSRRWSGDMDRARAILGRSGFVRFDLDKVKDV